MNELIVNIKNTFYWFVLSAIAVIWFIMTSTRHELEMMDVMIFFAVFAVVMMSLIIIAEKEKIVRKLNDPQIIVYIGLILLATGIIICAIDPLKSIEYLNVEFECNMLTEYETGKRYQKCIITEVEGYLDIEEFKKSNLNWDIDFIEDKWVLYER